MSNQFIAGHHDLYWAEAGASTTVFLGSTGDGDSGIEVIESPNIELIGSDALGPDSPVDGVYRGKRCVLQFILQEIKLVTAKKFLHPFTATTASPELAETFGIPGTLLSSYQGILELIPRTGTPAASYKTGGNGRRYMGVSIGEVRELLSTSKRFIPVTFQCFPFDDAGTTKMFKWITSANTT